MSLLDVVLSRRGDRTSREQYERMLPLMRAARPHQYIFDAEASLRLGKFAHECPDLILDNRQFARPPYEDCYVELDSRAFMRPFNEYTGKESLPTDDRSIGYFFSGQRCGTLSAVREDQSDAELLQCGWMVRRPEDAVDVEQQLGDKVMGHVVRYNREADGWRMIALALGTAIEAIHDEDTRWRLTRELTMHWTGDRQIFANLVRHIEEGNRAQRERALDSLVNLLTSHAGDVRNAWAALLWLNQPAKLMHLSGVAASSGLSRGRRVSYAAHNVVTIHLDATIPIRPQVAKSIRRSPKRHEVEGSFRHRGGDKNHGHTWPLLPDENEHWVCKGCGRKRWWTGKYMRGDATRGYVTKEYSVEP